MDIYTVLLYVLTFFAIMNLPISVSQPILLVITRHYRKIDFGDPVPGRKVIILIATVGKAYDVVKEIIADLKSMNTLQEINTDIFISNARSTKPNAVYVNNIFIPYRVIQLWQDRVETR